MENGTLVRARNVFRAGENVRTTLDARRGENASAVESIPIRDVDPSRVLVEEIFARINEDERKRREDYKARMAAKADSSISEELHIGEKLFTSKDSSGVRLGDYYVKNGLRFESYSKNDETKLRDLMLKQFNAGERCIQISFVNKESYDTAFKDLITDSRIYKVLSGVKSARGSSLSNSLTGYYEDKSFYTLTFIFK